MENINQPLLRKPASSVIWLLKSYACFYILATATVP